MQATIEVSDLHKRFGQAVALDGLSFTVAPGSVTGFVGPNGAGKSTTMRAILGLDAVDQGSALIGGRPYASLRNPLRHVGSLLDAGALQPSRRAQPSFVAGPLPGAFDRARGPGDRAGRA
jgi:ABC-2 type transport system ATP-binding protein